MLGLIIENNEEESKTGKVWDYSKQFEGELSNFNDGYQIKKCG